MTNLSYSINGSSSIIKYPIITDKTISDNNKYSFIVNPQSDKAAIKEAIEFLFDVKVIKINTCQLPKKKKRVNKYIGWKPRYKKAVVTLSDNDLIDLFPDN